MSSAMSSTFRNVPDKFLVAFSFAGEQRELVRAIAEAVEQRLGRGTVFSTTCSNTASPALLSG